MAVSTEWKDALTYRIAKWNHEEKTREELKEFFQEFAKEYQLASSTVRVNYYKIKKELSYIEEKKTTTYQVGNVVEVVITGITNYGVFAVTKDEEKHSGLIHVSEIRDFYIPDLHRYFKIGDIVQAKILKIDQEGKLSFSVKEMNLPDYFQSEIKETSITETMSESDSIIDYLTKTIGFISPEAKERLQQMISRHGLFKFSFAMGQVIPDLESDIGMILANQIEKKISDCL